MLTKRILSFLAAALMFASLTALTGCSSSDKSSAGETADTAETETGNTAGSAASENLTYTWGAFNGLSGTCEFTYNSDGTTDEMSLITSTGNVYRIFSYEYDGAGNAANVHTYNGNNVLLYELAQNFTDGTLTSATADYCWNEITENYLYNNSNGSSYPSTHKDYFWINTCDSGKTVSTQTYTAPGYFTTFCEKFDWNYDGDNISSVTYRGTEVPVSIDGSTCSFKADGGLDMSITVEDGNLTALSFTYGSDSRSMTTEYSGSLPVSSVFTEGYTTVESAFENGNLVSTDSCEYSYYDNNVLSYAKQGDISYKFDESGSITSKQIWNGSDIKSEYAYLSDGTNEYRYKFSGSYLAKVFDADGNMTGFRLYDSEDYSEIQKDLSFVFDGDRLVSVLFNGTEISTYDGTTLTYPTMTDETGAVSSRNVIEYSDDSFSFTSLDETGTQIWDPMTQNYEYLRESYLDELSSMLFNYNG